MSEASVWAVINNGIVENTILWDGVTEWSPCHSDDDVVEISNLPISPGWLYSDGHFSQPEITE